MLNESWLLRLVVERLAHSILIARNLKGGD